MSDKGNKVIPVFYLGGPRNGTTWLGNVLNTVFAIPTASHPLHYGFLESAICRSNLYWKDMRNINKYIEFLELYSSTDYFLLVNGDKEYFYKHRPENFYQFFFELMDRYAAQRDKNCWLVKLDPAFYIHPEEYELFESEVANRYEKVKYMAIQREFKSYMHSYLNMSGNSFQDRQKHRLSAIILGTARYVVYYEKIKNIIAKQSGLYISFKDLKENYHETIAKIEMYLGKKADLDKTSPFKKNTSFHSLEKKDQFNVFMRSIKWIFSTFPGIARLTLNTYQRFFARNSLTLYWRLKKEKYFKQRLIKEMQTTNNTMLVEYLQDQ